MTEKNEKHCFDLYDWLKECANKKPEQLTTFDKDVCNQLSRDWDAFNVLVSLSNDKIKHHFKIINALKKLITSKIQESKDPEVKKTLEIAKNFDTTGKNICTELQELTSNPEETFKDKNKVIRMIELNKSLILGSHEFIGNVLISVANDDIKEVSKAINDLEEYIEQVIPSRIQTWTDLELQEALENMIKIAENSALTGKNILRELQELIANPEEAFKNTDEIFKKILKMLELNYLFSVWTEEFDEKMAKAEENFDQKLREAKQPIDEELN